MDFIRKSLTGKALSLFGALIALLTLAAIVLMRQGVAALGLKTFFAVVIILMTIILIAFVVDVVSPLNRVVREIRHLLTGEDYRRVEPVTIDEIGVMTHFFNEITQDLEKISYDIKERRRMSSELDIAAQIQKDVLPKEAPQAIGLNIVAKTRTASEVGGDTFDFLASPDGGQTFIYIGDVTGHGVPAGLVMMMVDTLVTTLVSQGVLTGQELIIRTNALLTPRISTRIFMTAVMLRWDHALQKMYYTGAGHEHVLVYHAKTESVDAIQSGGIALGMIPDVSHIIQEKEIPLEPGDALVLYSDGITEAKNQTDAMYGLPRLQESLRKHGYRPTPEGIFDNLTNDFAQFVGPYVQVDDITMIVIKYTGEKTALSPVKLTVNVDKPGSRKSVWNWEG